MKITHTKSILALTLAFSIVSMPVKAQAVSDNAGGLAIVLGFIGTAAIIYANSNGGESVEYSNSEEEAARYANQREAEKREEARLDHQAAEANRQQQNCITGCAW